LEFRGNRVFQSSRVRTHAEKGGALDRYVPRVESECRRREEIRGSFRPVVPRNRLKLSLTHGERALATELVALGTFVRDSTAAALELANIFGTSVGGEVNVLADGATGIRPALRGRNRHSIRIASEVTVRVDLVILSFAVRIAPLIDCALRPIDVALFP